MFNLATTNMPSCFYNRLGISEAEMYFDRWLSQFDVIGSSCPSIQDYVNDHKSKAVNLKIEFSTDKPVKAYGYLSIEDIKDIIKKKWGWSETLEEIFRHIKDNFEDPKAMMREMEQAIVGAICRMHEGLDPKEVIEIIDELITEMVFISRIAARYIDGRKCIIFYVNHIGNSLENYESLFIHELFHAFHYYYAKKVTPLKYCDIVKRDDYTTEVVVESLASFYEYQYCKKHSIYSGWNYIWKVNKPEIYPYSGAKYINDVDFTHFLEIFFKSAIDMDVALRILLRDEIEIFYNIKNVKALTAGIKVDTVALYNDFVAAFKKHLADKGIDPGAIKSYVSYLTSAFNKCWGISDSVLVRLNYASQLHLARSLKAQLLAFPPAKIPESTINNWKTALGHLIDFLYSKGEVLTGDVNIAVRDVKSKDLAALEEFAKLYRGGNRTFKSTEILNEVFAITGRKLTCIIADFAAPYGTREHVFYHCGFDSYQIL